MAAIGCEQDRSIDEKPRDLESEEPRKATHQVGVDEDKARLDIHHEPHQSKVDASHDKQTPKQEPSETKAPSEPPKVSFDPSRINFPSHYDSDKKEQHPQQQHPLQAFAVPPPPPHFVMPGRIEPYPPMSSSRTRYDPVDPQGRRWSPPPVAAIPHSPSPSVSSATPPIRRTPPQSASGPPPHVYQPGYPPMDPALSRPYHYIPPPREMAHGAYLYHPPPPQYDHHPHHPHDPYHNSMSPHMQGPPMHPPPMHHAPHHHQPHMPQQPGRDGYGQYPHPSQANVQVVHTDDAATKLSDRVRRRCFNCCTTDTSTWRRSNLSPGKVLCNKCGLFERTHSRPRPEQFPHKRGPLASSTLRARSPPQGSQAQAPHAQPQLPPMSAPGGPPSYPYTHPPPPPPGMDRREYSSSSGGPNDSGHTTPSGGPPSQPWHHQTAPTLPPPPAIEPSLAAQSASPRTGHILPPLPVPQGPPGNGRNSNGGSPNLRKASIDQNGDAKVPTPPSTRPPSARPQEATAAAAS